MKKLINTKNQKKMIYKKKIKEWYKNWNGWRSYKRKPRKSL